MVWDGAFDISRGVRMQCLPFLPRDHRGGKLHQLLSFHGTADSLAKQLVPPGSRLSIVHVQCSLDEPDHPKVQHLSVEVAVVNYAAVVGRSPGGGDRLAPEGIIHDFVGRTHHVVDGISSGLSVNNHPHY